MSLLTLSKELYYLAAPKIGDTARFIERDSEVRLAVSSFDGIKTSLKERWDLLNLDYLRLACVLSDSTSLFLHAKEEAEIYEYNDYKNFPHLSLNILERLLERAGSLQKMGHVWGQSPLKCYYQMAFPADDDLKALVENMEPLAASGRILIRPMPRIVITNAEHENKFREIIAINPDSPFDSQFISQNIEQPFLPVRWGPGDPLHELAKADFVLPFISGISFADLAKVLDDEADNIQQFRAAIRLLIKSVNKGENTSHEVLNDVLRPAVAKVTKKFKDLTNLHSMKVGNATFATVVLSLTSLTLPGFAQGLFSPLATLLGTGGLGLVSKEYSDYIKSKQDLSDMPYYVLWRFDKLRPR